MERKPFKSFAVFGSMRSGSILLEKYLCQYQNLICHGELFNPSLIKRDGRGEYLGVSREDRLNNPEIMLDSIQRVNPDKIPGYRIFQDHNQWIINHVLADPNCAKIILTRDPIESFVSLEIARATGQWMISDTSQRRTVRIEFSLKKYSKYLKERQSYYRKLTDSLAKFGHPSFEIDYSDLKNLATINQLAAFVGAHEEKTNLDQLVQKQNPERLSDKISNYSEVFAALGLPAPSPYDAPVVRAPKERGTDLSRIYFCKEMAVALAPIPSVPDFSLRQWLALNDGAKTENGYSDQSFVNWKNTHPNAFLFSVAHHPVRRAYNTFMRKIFPTRPNSYLKIREQLQHQFGLSLPHGDVTADHSRAKLLDSHYGVDEHRINFKQFLTFVAGNLAYETNIRQDGKWQLQSEIVRRYQALYPKLYVFKVETLGTDLAYMSNRFGLLSYKGWNEGAELAFSLSEIYDLEIESLVQTAYEQDYNTFGYRALDKY